MDGNGAVSSAGKPGRNDPCPCGSGRKYKHCCASKEAGGDIPAANAPLAPTSKARATARRAAAARLWKEGKRDEAVIAFEEAVRLDPSNPDAHFDLGVAHFHDGRLSQAAEALERASELRPRFQNALRVLASIFEQLGREGDASSAFRQLSRMTDDTLERRFFLAKALVLEADLDEAEKEIQRVIAVAPDRAPAQALLGQLLSERGLFDEARPHLLRAVGTFPDMFQSLANSKRMTEDDRPLIERMRNVAAEPDLNPMQKAAVHFGLGKAFNDLAEYEEAMRHYVEGNRLKAASNRINRAATARLYHNLMSDFSIEALERRRARSARPLQPEDDLPVIIVGMMRSGSTLVEQILSSHPAVASGGELPFWADRNKKWLAAPPEKGSDSGFAPPPMDWTARSSFVKGQGPMLDSRANNWVPNQYGRLESRQIAGAAEDYLALLRKIGPEALRVTDKSLSNFERLGTIHLALPRARIIHCHRHPVDTCLSIFFSNIRGRHVWDRGDIVFWYRQYERLMEHWRRVLPPERFTEVEYETLIANREAETRRLIAFLGLEWDDACLAPERNERAVKTASIWQVRQPVYKTSVERWRRYEPWLGELRALLPKDGPISENTSREAEHEGLAS